MGTIEDYGRSIDCSEAFKDHPFKLLLESFGIGDEMWYIGIDNGSTGSITTLSENGLVMSYPTPTVKQLDFHKTKAKIINRVDVPVLREMLRPFKAKGRIMLERPFSNSMAYNASTLAMRAHEATLIVIEELHIPFKFVDSKSWQVKYMPPIIELVASKRKTKMKQAADDVAKRMFPDINIVFRGQGDSALIAAYNRSLGPHF